MGKEKKHPRPVWWKNTFFWFAGVLLILAVYGLVRGEETIRDPGQVREGGLTLIYLCGAVLMAVNGALTHSQAVRAFAEAQEEN